MTFRSLTHTFFALAALLALPFVLAGCETDEAPIESTEVAPPAPQIEEIPLIQSPQTEIWRPGYWALSGNTFYWEQGKIIPRPSPTAAWSSAHWVWHTYGWSFEQGHWQ